MSNSRLPPELLDHIVDLLHDTEYALKDCSLVSKSWVPRARKHLFANITFSSAKSLQSWKERFPDPLSSPARYAHTLSVTFVLATTAACDWIKGFSRVERFMFTFDRNDDDKPAVSLVPFYGFSPIVKSLSIFSSALPSSQVFDLVLSFPLLQDLHVISYFEQVKNGDGSDGLSTVIQPSNPPVFTGSLVLWMGGGLGFIVNWLLSLPSLRFRELTLALACEEDMSLATALVGECSYTLECLNITGRHSHGSSSISIDLSKAEKLKDVAFTFRRPDPEWVRMALQTVTHQHRNLQRITLRLPLVLLHPVPDRANPADIELAIGETAYRRWLELDHFLTQLLESRSIHLEVLPSASPGGDVEGQNGCVYGLLPEVTRRGMAHVAKRRE